jgi:hypothetical protein
MFLTLAKRAASLGSRFSIIVSCARLSGSACASSNLGQRQQHIILSNSYTHMAAAAAAAPLLCCRRRSNGRFVEADGRRTAVEVHLWQLLSRQLTSTEGRTILSRALIELRDNRDARISRRCSSFTCCSKALLVTKIFEPGSASGSWHYRNLAVEVRNITSCQIGQKYCST